MPETSPETGQGLDYRILTPDGVLREGRAISLSAVGLEGHFVLGQHHAPFMTMLGEGALRIEEEGGAQEFSLKGGFLDVFGGRARILAEIEDKDDS